LGDTTNVSRIANAIVSVYATDNENNEVLVKTDSTDSEGKYFIKLQQGNNYHIVFNKPGYFNRKLNFSTKAVTNSDTLHRSVSIRQIPRQPIIVKNIYYPFDKSYLTDTAKLVVDTTIYPILLENQEIVVEISSHTDSKGADTYNEKLSQERAQSVVNHLISKGIDKDRLVAKGYGESKPLAANEHHDGSDNPEGRQMNRRTEFKVIGIMKKYTDVIYEE
ncbi:MAG TPA: OmpA family protein, partial [Chitinophagaceae bacterium]|nr:OmpA family protein [Chitinophagaceae bacterium]